MAEAASSDTGALSHALTPCSDPIVGTALGAILLGVAVDLLHFERALRLLTAEQVHAQLHAQLRGSASEPALRLDAVRKPAAIPSPD